MSDFRDEPQACRGDHTPLMAHGGEGEEAPASIMPCSSAAASSSSAAEQRRGGEDERGGCRRFGCNGGEADAVVPGAGAGAEAEGGVVDKHRNRPVGRQL